MQLEQHVSSWDTEPGTDYHVLVTAARAALNGEPDGAAPLMRVFTEPGFAITNSLHEQGVAVQRAPRAMTDL